MGKYINKTSKGRIGKSFSVKLIELIKDGAIAIPTPTEFEENLVCLVNNGFFAAAAYCYDEREFEAFTDITDKREKAWLIWAKVKEYSE